MSRLRRFLVINITLARYGLDEILSPIAFFWPLRWLCRINPFNWFRSGRLTQAERLRLCIEALGPVFIKFGQMLSTRQDLLPDAVVTELEKLLDQVPPFPLQQARKIVEQQLGMSIETAFLSFDDQVLASASIAQVHAAQLQGGEPVVVKIVRPDIESQIREDVSLLLLFATIADRYWSKARHIKPIQIVREFEKTIINELDLIREAANASELRRHFEGSADLYIPQVYWDYCRPRVMVTERIEGIAVADIEQLRAYHIDLEVLSRKGVEIFLTQVYRNNYFHADMHSGNIFVSPENPQNPQYIAVDFGIMGSLSTQDQRYLAENFVAFFEHDYRRVAQLHLDCGWVDADTRIDDFEAAIRATCEPMFRRPLAEISFAQLLLRLFQTARSFNMEVQPQLLLLQKTFLHIEGLGRQLNPNLDLWETAKPFLQTWLSEQVGLRALLKGLKKSLPDIATKLPDLPHLTVKALTKIADGELQLRLESKQLDSIRAEIRRANQRSLRTLVGCSFILSASVIAGLDGLAPTMIGGGFFLVPLISGLLLVPGIYLLLSNYWRR